MTSLSLPSMSQTELRIKRKPPPFLDLSPSERYPAPDPNDPFAPLWVLRSRTSSAHLIQPESVYNLSLDRRRQSAFSLQYASHNRSNDDTRAVMSDGEHSCNTRHSLRQSQTRQRSHSLAMLANSGSQAYEFPSRHGQRPWTGLGERSYSSTDVERRDRSRALHIASDATPAQKKLSYFLKPKKLPRVHKASISGPVLTSKPPVMNAFSLTLQTSVADPPHAIVSSPLAQDAPRRRPSTAPALRVAPPQSQTLQLPITESISRKDSTVMRSPPTSSVSHSAFIQISYPTPSDIYPQPIYEDAYTSPRPAPRPPQDPAARRPLTLNHPRKTSSRPTSKTNKSKPLPVVPQAAQSEWGLPSREELSRAASLLVIAESGVRVTFGSLFEKQRTIVIFIRHFWCHLCQDYMSSVRSFVRPDVLRSPAVLGADGSPAKLVIISNGSHAMISKYRQIFRMPFDMYTDPTLAVYSTLGMSRGRDADHPLSEVSPKDPPATDRRKKEDMIRNGGYVKHGTMGGIVMVVMRAIKVGMPVWEKGGDIAQLGGEFVFGPGLTCSFAHRMQSPKGHAPIQDVVKAALEVAATRTSAAEKRKPLPAVDVHDDRPASSPVKSTGIEDSTCSYEIVSDEIHAESQEGRGVRISEAEEGCTRRRDEGMPQELPQCPEKSCWEESVLTLDRENGPNSDVASVTGTCSDQERSDGSTVQHSTESENTLNDSIEDASGQVYAKSPERPQSAQLELEN